MCLVESCGRLLQHKRLCDLCQVHGVQSSEHVSQQQAARCRRRSLLGEWVTVQDRCVRYSPATGDRGIAFVSDPFSVVENISFRHLSMAQPWPVKWCMGVRTPWGVVQWAREKSQARATWMIAQHSAMAD